MATDFPGANNLLPKTRDLVLYCSLGSELSQNTSQQLRDQGFNALFLDGGYGAWETSGLPTMQKVEEVGLPSSLGRPTKWITRERPKIDRIACPWLISRFIDPLAEFHYVPAGEVLEAGRARGALPYDVPGVRFTHRGAEGELCSFDALVADCALDDPCVRAVALIVRGADTGRPELTQQSHGLMAVSLGLSQVSPDSNRAHGRHVCWKSLAHMHDGQRAGTRASVRACA